jgi:CP12 domain
MENIQQHIQKDEDILSDPLISSQSRRHIEGELEALKSYQQNHPEDDHDPTPLELYCDAHPDAPECRIFED